jgi:hypothetical protein
LSLAVRFLYRFHFQQLCSETGAERCRWSEAEPATLGIIALYFLILTL